MKINGKLQMNFGPVGDRVVLDNYNNTTVKVNGAEPFEIASEGRDCFDQAGFWITPEFKAGDDFSLGIPSGIFIGKVIAVEKKMEDQQAIYGAAALGQVREHEAKEMQVIAVEGQWNGKQGGINSYADGGLSGLGRFFLTDISSVEGTFGKAVSLAEYKTRADSYRQLYWSIDTDPKTGAIRNSLTLKGEALLRRYLSQFTLNLDDVARHSPYEWGTTPLQYALAKVRWEKDNNQYEGEGLRGWVNLPSHMEDIPCTGEQRIGFRSFRQWLDLQFTELNEQAQRQKLSGQLERQQQRTHINPTERNLRRLARYQTAFVAR